MDDLTKLSLEELTELATTQQGKWSEFTALETPSTEQLAEFRQLAEDRDAVDAEFAARKEAEKPTEADEFAALKERTFAAGDKEPEQEPDQAKTDDQPEGKVDEPEAEAKVEAPAENQAASVKDLADAIVAAIRAPVTTTPRPGAVERLAGKRPAQPDAEPERFAHGAGPVTITASAGNADFSAGQSLDMAQVGQAVLDQVQSFPAPDGRLEFDDPNYSADWRRHGTAKFKIDFPDELIVQDMNDIEGAEEAMKLATDESKLPGGSLVASAGWCAPSETMYDLDLDATREGLLSLPEVGVRRGGMRFPVQSNFADFYANPGFTQTETQAIAGTTKPCVEVPCPTFTDVRLDVEGVCIRVPILLNVGYPEQVANFTQGTLIAHDHWINANVIGRLVTAAGSAKTPTGLGAVSTDTLEALVLMIVQKRQVYRLSQRATMEVVLPFWVRDMLKVDISRRTGRDEITVTDAEVAAFFTNIGANVQWVYDWQNLSGTAVIWPASFQALVYPAGTFVKGVQPVISLDTVYDAASLAVNTFTGLFTEQAFLVAKKKLSADLVTISTASTNLCTAGRTGAANQTCS